MNDYKRESEQEVGKTKFKRERFSSVGTSAIFWVAKMNAYVGMKLGENYDSLYFYHNSFNDGKEIAYICAIHKYITNDEIKEIIEGCNANNSDENKFDEISKKLDELQKSKNLKLWPIVSNNLRNQWKKNANGGRR